MVNIAIDAYSLIEADQSYFLAALDSYQWWVQVLVLMGA